MVSQRTPKSVFLFKVLRLISTLQHLSIVLRMGLEGYPKSLVVGLIARILTYFSPEPFFENPDMIVTNSIVLQVGFWGIFLTILVSLVMVLSGLGSKSVLKQDTKLKISLEKAYSTIFGFLLLLFRKIGFFPLIQIFGSHCSCFVKNRTKVSSSQCLGIRASIFNVILSIFGLLLTLAISWINQIFVNESYFDSTLPFSAFLSRLLKSEILLETLLALISVSIEEVTKQAPQTLYPRDFQTNQRISPLFLKFLNFVLTIF